jgi:pimeloyl-ACP methyl ester carboxylesterase
MGPAADSPPDRPRARLPERPARRPDERLVALADGRRLSVRMWPGAGPPVVILHGLLDSAVGCDNLAGAMPGACIAFDLPGFGGSDMPTRPRLSAYADDVIDALGRLGIERFVLVGHSLGGGVAAVMADRIPERVAMLVLLAPAGFGRIHLAEAVSIPGFRNVVARALPLALANPLVLTTAYMTMVTNRTLPDAQLLQRVMRRAFESVPGAREATRAVVAAGLSERGLHRRRLSYRGPVRVLWGERDRLVPSAHLRGVRKGLPQAQVEIWPDMGHHPHRERPDDLARLVIDACAECSLPESDSGAAAAA